MNAADLLSPFSGWLEEENAEVSSSQSHYLKLAPVAITGSALKNIYNNHVVYSAVSTVSSIRRRPTTQPYPISLHSVSSTIALGQLNKKKIFNFFYLTYLCAFVEFQLSVRISCVLLSFKFLTSPLFCVKCRGWGWATLHTESRADDTISVTTMHRSSVSAIKDSHQEYFIQLQPEAYITTQCFSYYCLGAVERKRERFMLFTQCMSISFIQT